MKLLFILSALYLVALSACSQATIKDSDERINKSGAEKTPYVVLVSLDGYRYDYTDLYSAENLKKLRETGSSAESLVPIYPSKTFTNHYSIATGLYAENHEIVSNQFYDPVQKKEFLMSTADSAENGNWYKGEPLWVTIEKQGLVTACYFWPGCQAEIHGTRPKYFFHYDDKIEPLQRVHQAIEWLKLPEEKRPHFIALYLSDVDTAGHKFGPNSVEVKNAVQKVDQIMGELFSEIEKIPLEINVVVLSDHGMENIDPNKVIYLDDAFKGQEGVKILGEGPQTQVYTSGKGQTNQIYKVLSRIAKKSHFKVYKRESLPERLHYSRSPKAGDLILIAEAPYSLVHKSTKLLKNHGNHGYDAEVTKAMHGIFYAKGPEITSGIKLKSFKNIDIYPWILKLLTLNQPNPIDGSSTRLDPLLKH